MALNDVKSQDPGGFNVVPTAVYQTDAGTTVINAGEPVKLTVAGGVYVTALADAEPVIGTTTPVVGIAASTSTQTASVDGTVEVHLPVGEAIWAAQAKTASLADTQAEIDALQNKRVVLDLTSGVYTVDTAAADGATNGIVIVGGDPNTSTIYFRFRESGTILN